MRPARLPADLLSPSELEHVFQQERARVDRNRHVFSMVVFAPAQDAEPELRSLVRVLRQRMRVYDVLGLLDARRVALLLPETGSRGAWTFADDALTRLAERGLSFGCEVYCYPADWAEHGEERSAGPRLTIAEERGPREPERDAPRPAVPGSEERGSEERASEGGAEPDATPGTGTDGRPQLAVTRPRTEPGLATLRGAAATRPVRDLEPLFVQPLPPLRRAVDVLVSATALVALSPLFALLAILIKATTPGPVIFRQRRAGLGGRPFTFYKFRSMYIDAEQRLAALRGRNIHKHGPIFKDPQDPRITPIGRVLRKTSIDELPQLLNVLLGDMTLIGPRPPKLEEVEHYEPWQRRRLEVTGGLTCIWQVSGRSEIGFEDWVRMDIQYQERRSLLLDLKLLFRTVGAVLTGRGAY